MDLRTWTSAQLSNLVDIDISSDIINYLLSFDTASDLEEYILELDPDSKPDQNDLKSFITQFLSKKQSQPIPKPQMKLNPKSSTKNSKPREQTQPKKNTPNTFTFTPEFVSSIPRAAPVKKHNEPPPKPSFQYVPQSKRGTISKPFPTFEEEEPTLFLKTKPKTGEKKSTTKTMPNTGDWCMTMVNTEDVSILTAQWQPWASLLVEGIKKVEGRGWYSDHRGRLWIHSGSRKPTIEEIDAVEGQYIGTTEKPFPQFYPTSVLLGCVEVVDMLSHEEYMQQAPEEEENGSEFVFVCKNPQKLVVPLDASGDHKIWKLDKKLLKQAETSLQFSKNVQ